MTTASTRPETGHADTAPQRARTRLEAKHRYRLQKRAANRRARQAQTAADDAAMDARYGQPTF